jgi:hypothetical protein
MSVCLHLSGLNAMTMKAITVAPTIKYGFEASKLVVVLHDQLILQLLQQLLPKPPPLLKN